ncbi:MAG: hypothetical protein JKY51_10440 [Opitutaceae bacterium]|nr:hypothetical protein [Opitutaceae bacterium]
MNTPDLTDPAQTYCPYCKEDVIPRLTPDQDETTSRPAIEVIGLTHMEKTTSRHFHGECPHCGHHLYSEPAEELNKALQKTRWDTKWEGIFLTIGAIVLFGLIFFIFNS